MIYISFIFVSVSVLAVVGGLNVIRLNRSSNLNKVFLFLTLALSIWSLGFAMANLVQNLDAAILWRRVASVGMISLYSFFLHFVLLLNRQDDREQLDRVTLLLYAPTILLIYAFTLSPTLANRQYDLIQTNYGVINIATNTLWNYTYYIYYLFYTLLSIKILQAWRGKLKNKTSGKQADVIIYSIWFAVFIGTFMDIVLPLFLSVPLPQLVPLFIIMPVWSMYYAAKEYGILEKNQISHTEMIVTTQDKKRIFRNLSRIFYLGAFITLISQYPSRMNQDNFLETPLLQFLILISLGIAISLMQNIKNENYREKITIFILVGSIPLITLQYVNYGGATVWIFPLIILISSIIFSKLTLLVSITIAAIFTQIYMWIIRPAVNITINKYDYISRIGTFIIAFLIGLYMNKLYVSKIKENKHQITFQKMVSDILFEFVSIDQENYENKIYFLLTKIGIFFEVDKVYLLTIDQQAQKENYLYEWCNNKSDIAIEKVNNELFAKFPWLNEHFKNQSRINILDIDLMPTESEATQKYLRNQGIKSLLSLPVLSKNKTLAFIGIGSGSTVHLGSAENIERLNIIANILYGGLMQVELDQEIKSMAYYDNLTNLPNRFLFENRIEQAINLSKRTGKYIAIIFIDLDNFKTVNDTAGHKGGDDLLRLIANELSNTIRETDTVARFGGDEFLIMIDELTDLNIINQITDKVIEIFAEPFMIQNHEFEVTASAGVSVYPHDGEEIGTLITKADIAMYQAKVQGKNQYAFYNHMLNSHNMDERIL